MARPHIEFIQSQNVEWATASPGSDFAGGVVKPLSQDLELSSYTALVRLPAGWTGAGAPGGRNLELYLLDGSLVVDGVHCPRHSYVFRPAGMGLAGIRAPQGAELVCFADDARDPIAARSAGSAPLVVDAAAMAWDVSTYDPKLTHLALARKVLRLGPDASSRTYVLAGLPHGYPRGGELQIELHPHAEEMFLIHGEMSCQFGVMTTGAYFYRPAEVWHGLHASEFGFLMVLRSPGTDRIVTHWSEERRPVPVDPPYRPVLPPGTPESLRRTRPTRPVY